MMRPYSQIGFVTSVAWFILGRNKEEKIRGKDVIVTQEDSSSHILEETIVKEGINNGQIKGPHEDMEVRNVALVPFQLVPGLANLSLERKDR